MNGKDINWDVVIGEPGWSDGLEPYPAFRRTPKKPQKPKTSVASHPARRHVSEVPLRRSMSSSAGAKGGKNGFRSDWRI